MNDELQRRLEAADPLTVSGGTNFPRAHFDRLKEDALMAQKTYPKLNSRVSKGAAIAAISLAGFVLATGLHPQKTLAFSPVATNATAAQVEAANAKCGTSLNNSLFSVEAIELFGNGGVAVESDESVTSYCMVVVDGDDVSVAAVLEWESGSEFIQMVGGSTGIQGETVSIIAGKAPEGAIKVDIEGLDGASASVVGGYYSFWLPQTLTYDLVARDANGTELKRETLPFGN
jgi:hypothetical protein